MVKTQLIFDWNENSGRLLLNPEWPLRDQELFANSVSQIETSHAEAKNLIWIATSGSSAKTFTEVKLVGLKRSALLASAEAVNRHLQSTKADIWGQVLPLFHVGGLGIEARGFLSGARVICCFSSDEKWSPEFFFHELEKNKVTLTSLVPTQVYDLVKKQLRSPQSLRAVVVGGGALNHELYQAARDLGWPLLPSYGLTEACSQVATASLESLNQKQFPKLKILSHVQTRTAVDQRLSVKGSSLFSGYIVGSGGQAEFIDPKDDGWFQTEDFADLQNEELTPLGRKDEIVKIGGENVSLPRIREILKTTLLKSEFKALNQDHLEIINVEDARLGTILKWVIESNVEEKIFIRLKESVDLALLPFERPRQIVRVQKIPRSPLGKPLVEQIRKLIEEKP